MNLFDQKMFVNKLQNIIYHAIVAMSKHPKPYTASLLVYINKLNELLKNKRDMPEDVVNYIEEALTLYETEKNPVICSNLIESKIVSLILLMMDENKTQLF